MSAARKKEEDELRSAALATSAAILTVQRRADRELMNVKHTLELQARELAQSISMLNATLDATGSGILAVDVQGHITFYNATLTSIWQIESDASMESHAAFLEAKARLAKDPAGFLARTREVYAHPEEESFDILELADGRLIERHVKPQRLEGRCVGTVSNYRDVTERLLAAERAGHSQRLAALGTLAAGMAHEINNPLAYVSSNVELCREELAQVLGELDASSLLRPSLEHIDDSLRDAIHGAERVRRIVGNLRTLSEKTDGIAMRIDLGELLRATFKMTHNNLRHSARLRSHVEDGLFVEALPGTLEQVFTNLLINAANAIGEGHATEHGIEVKAFRDPGGRVVVEVRDDGPGIPHELLELIFEPFFTTQAGVGGMGIGLSICRNLVVAARGLITAENVAGGGALFRVALPAATAAATAPVPATPSPSVVTPHRRGRVLVVDDEAAVAKALGRILGASHDVTVVGDGHEAIARVAAGETYDVILCDLMMPNISGGDVHDEILRLRPAQAQRIIFMTGGALSARAEAILATATNRHIAKPFGIEEVRRVVQEHVDRTS